MAAPTYLWIAAATSQWHIGEEFRALAVPDQNNARLPRVAVPNGAGLFIGRNQPCQKYVMRAVGSALDSGQSFLFTHKRFTTERLAYARWLWGQSTSASSEQGTAIGAI